MADNVAFTDSVATYAAAADEVTYSGDTAKVQLARLVHVSGSEGAKTLTEIVTAPGSPSASFALTVHEPKVSAYHFVSAASDNAASVKASAGNLRGLHIYNNGAVPVFLKFHNTAGTPTAGASVARTFGIQAGTSCNLTFPGGGIAFATGIGITCVTGAADAGTGNTSASAVVGEIFYE